MYSAIEQSCKVDGNVWAVAFTIVINNSRYS